MNLQQEDVKLIKLIQMENKHWLLDIPFFKAIVIILTTIYCIAPPVVYIFTMQPELFKSLDIFKTLLLAVSFGSLLFAMCFFICLSAAAILLRKQYTDIEIYSGGIIFTLANYTIIFLINLLSYVIDNHFFTLKESVTAISTIMSAIYLFTMINLLSRVFIRK